MSAHVIRIYYYAPPPPPPLNEWAQGSQRLEKYLNIQDRLEKALKIKFALEKYLKKHSKALKSPWILSFTGGFNSVFGDLNQYKIVVPAAPNKGTIILY